MAARTDLDVLLTETATNVQMWFETKNLIPTGDAASLFFDSQTWSAAIRLVSAAEPLIHYCATVVGDLLPVDEAGTVTTVLHYELARACTSGWVGARSSHEADVAVGLTAHIRDWLLEWKRSGRVAATVTIKTMNLKPGGVVVQVRPEAFSYVVMASLDRDMEEIRDDAYLFKLQRVRSTLGIRPAELARLLRVSREAIRKWESGDPISKERWADIDKLNTTIDALVRFIRPENLPAVVRRPVPALDNATPLDWLAARRFDELISFYERVFAFGSTA